MNGNKIFTRVPKKTFSREEAEILLEHISNKSVMISGEKMPTFVRGYLISMLTTIASRSPSAAKELLANVNCVRSL